MKSMKKPLIASASAALMMGLGSTAAVADNPFSAESLESGYNQLAENHKGDKDHEGKCGEDRKKDKDREGKCGDDKKDKKDKDGEGKCGEGSCGA